MSRKNWNQISCILSSCSIRVCCWVWHNISSNRLWRLPTFLRLNLWKTELIGPRWMSCKTYFNVQLFFVFMLPICSNLTPTEGMKLAWPAVFRGNLHRWIANSKMYTHIFAFICRQNFRIFCLHILNNLLFAEEMIRV